MVGWQENALVSGKRAAKIAVFRNGGLKSVDAALAYTYHGCHLQPDSENFEQGVTTWERIWYSSFNYHRQIYHPEEYKNLL